MHAKDSQFFSILPVELTQLWTSPRGNSKLWASPLWNSKCVGFTTFNFKAQSLMSLLNLLSRLQLHVEPFSKFSHVWVPDHLHLGSVGISVGLSVGRSVDRHLHLLLLDGFRLEASTPKLGVGRALFHDLLHGLLHFLGGQVYNQRFFGWLDHQLLLQCWLDQLLHQVRLLLQDWLHHQLRLRLQGRLGSSVFRSWKPERHQTQWQRRWHEISIRTSDSESSRKILNQDFGQGTGRGAAAICGMPLHRPSHHSSGAAHPAGRKVSPESCCWQWSPSWLPQWIELGAWMDDEVECSSADAFKMWIMEREMLHPVQLHGAPMVHMCAVAPSPEKPNGRTKQCHWLVNLVQLSSNMTVSLCHWHQSSFLCVSQRHKEWHPMRRAWSPALKNHRCQRRCLRNSNLSCQVQLLVLDKAWALVFVSLIGSFVDMLSKAALSNTYFWIIKKGSKWEYAWICNMSLTACGGMENIISQTGFHEFVQLQLGFQACVNSSTGPNRTMAWHLINQTCETTPVQDSKKYDNMWLSMTKLAIRLTVNDNMSMTLGSSRHTAKTAGSHLKNWQM